LAPDRAKHLPSPATRHWIGQRLSAAASLLADEPELVGHRVTAKDADVGRLRGLMQQLLDRDLVRKPAVVRTLDIWFGYQWGAVSDRVVRGVLTRALDFLTDATARHDSLASADAETTYLALWATACFDIDEAAGRAADLLDSANVERRFVAVHLLDQLDLPAARRYLAEAIDDEDLRVALRALEGCQVPEDAKIEEVGVFEHIERLLPRLPEQKQPLSAILWPWQVLMADRADAVAELEEHLGHRPPTRLLPYLSRLDAEARTRFLHRLQDAKLKTIDILALETFLPGSDHGLSDGILNVIEAQTDHESLASLGRLLDAALPVRRRAGLELAGRLLAKRSLAARCRKVLETHQAGRRHRRPDEDKLLTELLRKSRKKAPRKL
jgi:hypothetical protein